jgi:NAD(P)-dependent dehydrogenase (short-subunit alcohol dehydrogenase family)
VEADLQSKVVVVTGVARAGQVGAAVAQAAAAAGARLVIADLNAAALAERARDLEQRGASVRAVAADLASIGGARQMIEAARQAFGGVDVLLNVAGGFFYYGPFADAPAEMLDKELAVNFKTAYFAAQAAVPALIARGGGAIVNFASLAAVRPMANMAPYAAAKAAVAGLTMALARELHEHHIRVNAVAPATIRTAANVAQAGADPSARYVEMDEVVRAVLFLAGEAAGGVTGQIIAVTGRAY